MNSAKPRIGICHLCCKEEKLTFEHVPPKSAFNSASGLLSYKFDIQGRRWIPTKEHPYGIGEYTLCAKCNNDTGGTYGQAFCDFVSSIAEATKANTSYRQPIRISYKGFLNRILKQILVMFCTANGIEFSRKKELARHLLDFKSTTFPQDLNVYLLLVNRRSNISTGLQGILKLSTNQTIVASEILFWPLGYVLSYEKLAVTDIEGAFLTDITHWKDYDVDARVQVEFDIYRNYRLTMFPLDFRSKDEIEASSGEPIKPPGVFPFIDYEI